MTVFLDLHGYDLDAPAPEVVRIMLGVAAGEVAEPELAAWVQAHLVPRGG